MKNSPRDLKDSSVLNWEIDRSCNWKLNKYSLDKLGNFKIREKDESTTSFKHKEVKLVNVVIKEKPSSGA